MTDLRTAAQEALEALKLAIGVLSDEDETESNAVRASIKAIKTALEQPEQEQPEQDTDCHAQGICQRSGYSIGQPEQEPDRWGAGYEAGYAAGMAEPEQEPVAWMFDWDVYDPTNLGPDFSQTKPNDGKTWTPLYTHPPRREWRGLTDTERAAVQYESFKRGLTPLEFMELHEAALRSKNHG